MRMKSSLPSVLCLFVPHSNAPYYLTLAYIVHKAQPWEMCVRLAKHAIVRVLTQIRVAATFYTKFIPTSMIFMSRTEYLRVINLPYLTGHWHF